MKNNGKKFEDDFKKSVPKNAFYYRFRDSGSNFYGGNNNLRFTPSNIADNLVFYNSILYLNELKCHKGKSIPLNCIIGNKTKEKQIKDLLEADGYDNINCYLIIFFIDIERCFALNINNFKNFIETEERQSIPLSYLEQNGIEIKTSKKRTSYIYDLEAFYNGRN